ncbi:MAG TPA: site-specific integrase [Candidatus Fournierella excrementavium]|nr:site-specific integrase [Candidatus Fournierella excrementavium]
MICVNCQKQVSDGLFCSICGWNQHKNPETCTLKAVYTRWKKRKHYRGLGPKGKEGYDLAWNWLRRLGGVPIQTITFDDFQNILDEMAAAGLSVSMQQKVQQLISQLNKQAISDGILSCNLASELVLEGREARETLPFEMEHISLLLEHAKSGTYAQAAQITLVLLTTGFRPQELFSIRCEDIDPRFPFLCSGSKTQAGRNRLVPILPMVRPFLIKWYLGCPVVNGQKQGYLVRGPKGARKNLTNWRAREFYPMTLELGINRPDQLTDKHNIPHITPYSARHGFATLSARAGVEKDVLIKVIGHSSYATTEKFYIHASLADLPEMQEIQREAQKLAKYLEEHIAI